VKIGSLHVYLCVVSQHVTDLSGRETLVRITGIWPSHVSLASPIVLGLMFDCNDIGSFACLFVLLTNPMLFCVKR
jgi:hypothetical protein